MGMHTVEKIGGTSMTRFGELLDNIFIGNRKMSELYNRVFVVSAYGGITNMLLENKKTGEPGIYGHFKAGGNWRDKLEETRNRMLELNRSFADIGLDLKSADDFVNERMDGIADCLEHLVHLRSYNLFGGMDPLAAVRELLSSVGESHSAFNSVDILKHHGVDAVLVDLSGWKDRAEAGEMEDVIAEHMNKLDFAKCMPIVTGYAKCRGGIMAVFDRGYSEITFSKIAVVTGAREGVIHKEFHLSTGDPKLIGTDKVRIIGNTNFDIADQLSDMAMEAIHPKASKAMERHGIPIRVDNAFDPGCPGTLISSDYVSPVPRVDMICGRKDIVAIEVFDPEMVGACGYDHKLTEALVRTEISYIAKNTNANTITHFLPQKARRLQECIDEMQSSFPTADIKSSEVAIVAVLGSNMKFPGFLSRAARALAGAGINILALDQSPRQVSMQFIVKRDDFEEAVKALHREFVENEK